MQEGRFEGVRQPVKIDVSTDDVITPAAIEYDYRLMFEDRTIKLMSYNTETLRQAFSATCNKRKTVFAANQVADILNLIENDNVLRDNWAKYGIKNEYARGIEWYDVVSGIKSIILSIILR